MVLIILLVFALVLATLMLVAAWGTSLALTKLVGERHQVLEQIVETGQVPRIWSEPVEKTIAKLRQDPRNARKIASLQARGTEQYLKKLDRLTRYVETTRLVDGEDTRQVLLDRLAHVRTTWQTGHPPG